jgi:pSer/pThr/pTyr-binding forkhead associated (FHA) protein
MEPSQVHIAARRSPAAEAGLDPSYSALLVVKRGSNAGPRLLFDQPVTIRRPAPEQRHLFLHDFTVSRHHAEFNSPLRRRPT